MPPGHGNLRCRCVIFGCTLVVCAGVAGWAARTVVDAAPESSAKTLFRQAESAYRALTSLHVRVKGDSGGKVVPNPQMGIPLELNQDIEIRLQRPNKLRIAGTMDSKDGAPSSSGCLR